MNIVELFSRQVAARPDAVAIVHGDRQMTFAELDTESLRLARSLARDGLQPGDVVLVFCPMNVPLYVTLLAIFRLGLVAMFVDPSAGRRHIDRCCSLCPPRMFVAGLRAHLLRLISPAIRAIPIHRIVKPILAVRWSRRVPEDMRRSIEPRAANAPALITFTTGSTGEPKAAVRTHGFLTAQHRAIENALRVTPGDIDLTTLPMFVLANLASGVTTILPDADMRAPAKADPAPVLRQIRRYTPTRIVGSPAFLARLASVCLDRGETIENVSHVFTGGGPVTPRVLDRLAVAAPGAHICGVYGSTEAEPIAIVDQRDLRHAERTSTRSGKGLLAGVPIPALDVRIIADRWGQPIEPMTSADFQKLSVSVGQPGEIVASGDHVLPGYLHGLGDSETKFTVDRTKWHRTGDAGYFDASGRLWLLGRCNAAIHDAAGMLYPFAAEAVAEGHPEVERAALLADGGRRVLVIEPRTRFAPELVMALQTELEWAALDEIRLQRIPVDPRHNAKVDYGRLRASYWSPAASFTIRMCGPQRSAPGAISNTIGPAAS